MRKVLSGDAIFVNTGRKHKHETIWRLDSSALQDGQVGGCGTAPVVGCPGWQSWPGGSWQRAGWGDADWSAALAGEAGQPGSGSGLVGRVGGQLWRAVPVCKAGRPKAGRLVIQEGRQAGMR